MEFLQLEYVKLQLSVVWSKCCENKQLVSN